MGYSKLDYQLTDQWVDITTLTGYDDIDGVDISIYAKYANPCYVFVGGNTAPSNNNGILLTTGNKVTSNSDHWWVKGSGTIAIFVENNPA